MARFPSPILLCAALFVALALCGCSANVQVRNETFAAVQVAVGAAAPRVLETGALTVFSNVPAGFFDPDARYKATGSHIDTQERVLLLLGTNAADLVVTNNVCWLELSNRSAADMTVLYVWPTALSPYYLATTNLLSNASAIPTNSSRLFRLNFGGSNSVRAGTVMVARQATNLNFRNVGKNTVVLTATNLFYP